MFVERPASTNPPWASVEAHTAMRHDRHPLVPSPCCSLSFSSLILQGKQSYQCPAPAAAPGFAAAHRRSDTMAASLGPDWRVAARKTTVTPQRLNFDRTATGGLGSACPSVRPTIASTG